MHDSNDQNRSDYIARVATKPCSTAVKLLADALQENYPGAAIVLYGSGNSVLSAKNPSDVLFDFYVIAPSYKNVYRSPVLQFLNYAIPPNVFYIEQNFDGLNLRAKYAVLSIGHFEKLVSEKTFHSYFWARFAQPCIIVAAPEKIRTRVLGSLTTAVDTFVKRAAPLVQNHAPVPQVWRAGLQHSYKAELRAEQPERVDALLESYGEWPVSVTLPNMVKSATTNAAWKSRLAWQVRAIQGGFLSVIRLLKATLTFQGGVDYMAWKISRHAGFALPVKDWERRFPIIGAPFLAARYYTLKNRHSRRAE